MSGAAARAKDEANPPRDDGRLMARAAKDREFPSELGADRDRALALVPVSRETQARLDRLVALLLDWQAKTNLIAPSTVETLWTRHIADSLQLLALAPDAKCWVDLGSGAGFPGLVVACALADTKAATVHLVESNAKKAAFLREAARHTDVPAIVHAMRIEDFVKNFKGSVDVVSARALAPLNRLLTLARPLLEQGAVGLLLKGQDVDAELTEASKYWIMTPELVVSKTDPRSRIVIVRGLRRRVGTKAN
jgi:16S rRNA (guanine527-N7)-methyltransferase